MRLIGYNLTQQSPTNVSASSSNVNFPASNIKHEHRSKQWRSSGNFVVNSSNNKINFKESDIGSELTATISSNTYTAASLALEIKTQLEAVGANDYTITYSLSTGLWTIVSSGAYFSLLNNTGTNNANSLLKVSLGFANSDRTGSLTYTAPKIAIHTQEYVTFDFRTTEDVNSVVLLWPKEDGITISSNAVIKVQANATDVWTSPAVDQTLTVDDDFEVASHFFSSNQSYRYWRVVIIDPENAYLYVNLGVVILGTSEQVDNPDNGFNYSLKDNSVITSTDYGHEYVDEYPTKAQLEINYNILDYDQAKAIDNLYRQVGTRKPVYISIEHDEVVFSQNHFSIYGKFKSDFGLQHVTYNYFQSKMTIGEIS